MLPLSPPPLHIQWDPVETAWQLQLPDFLALKLIHWCMAYKLKIPLNWFFVCNKRRLSFCSPATHPSHPIPPHPIHPISSTPPHPIHPIPSTPSHPPHPIPPPHFAFHGFSFLGESCGVVSAISPIPTTCTHVMEWCAGDACDVLPRFAVFERNECLV